MATSQVAQTVKCLPAILETQVQPLGGEDLLEKAMANHSSTLAYIVFDLGLTWPVKAVASLDSYLDAVGDTDCWTTSDVCI